MSHIRQAESLWTEVEPYCVLRRIWKNLWMVLMSAGLFVLLAYIGATLLVRPSYTCTTTFVVTPRSSSYIYQSSASAVTTSTAEQFAKLLSGQTLVSRVKRLSGEDVAGAEVSAQVVEGTNLIQLRTTGDSPRSAYYMCIGILEHYEDYAQYVFDSVVLDTITAPTVPGKGAIRTVQRKTVLVAAPLGALAMIAILALLCITSGTVQTIQGAREQVDGNLLATLNHQHKRRTLKSLLGRKKKALLISNPTTSFLYMETIHQLRARIEHANRAHGCKTFVVSSVSENEGKSTVAANLALSLARRYKKVLLVDCDLRKSAQHLIFEATEKSATLNELLKEELDPERLVKALQYRKAENLFFLFASNVKRHSADLLGSERMKQLLAVLRDNFDYVILDSSPMGFFTDSEILADSADASFLVVRQDAVSDKTVNDAIDSLSRCKARFLGFVFNDVHTFNLAAGLVGGRRYGYGYGYGRSYGYAYGSGKSTQGYGYAPSDVELNTSRKEARRGNTEKE